MKNKHTQEEIAYNRAFAVCRELIDAENGSALRASLQARFDSLMAEWQAIVKKGGALSVQDAIDKDTKAFRALSKAYRYRLRALAFAYLAEHPGCGDHNGFWRGLSARHVTQITEVSR
jgi:hypothetical protein